MGYFTWTDARYKNPQKSKRYPSCYLQRYVIGYDSYAKIVCPDDTEIVEHYYDGYGDFNGQDVYDLVAEWNKPYLKDIFEMLKSDDRYKDHLRFAKPLETLAITWQEGDEISFQKELKMLSKKDSWLEKEWKRNIGIAIACGDVNKMIPYPIKITKSHSHIPYEDLYPSLSTQ